MSGPSGRRPDPAWRQRLGRAAEALAARHLEARGCTVVARRYRVARGEVDLVVRDGCTVVFVEVKARRGTAKGHPAEAVDARKRRQIVGVARAWLAEHGPAGPLRFDVVAVTVGGGRARVRWIRDAFRA